MHFNQNTLGFPNGCKRVMAACSNPPRRGLASVGVGVLGAPDPAPEAVTNYYVMRPPPLEDSPSQNPAMQPLKMIAMEF